MPRLLSFDVGARHLSFSLLRNDGTTWKSLIIENWECVDCILESGCQVKDSRTIPAHRAMCMVREALLKRPYLFDPSTEDSKPLDRITIEQQPLQRHGVGSARNKIIAHAIWMFCDLYFRLKRNEEPPLIQMESAKHKLLVHTNKDFFGIDSKEDTKTDEESEDESKVEGSDAKDKDEPDSEEADADTKEEKLNTSTYRDRKKSAVILTQRVLALIDPEQPQNSKAISVFKNFKGKRDDLSDCFLQGVYKLQNPDSKTMKKLKLKSKTTKTTTKTAKTTKTTKPKKHKTEKSNIPEGKRRKTTVKSSSSREEIGY